MDLISLGKAVLVLGLLSRQSGYFFQLLFLFFQELLIFFFFTLNKRFTLCQLVFLFSDILLASFLLFGFAIDVFFLLHKPHFTLF